MKGNILNFTAENAVPAFRFATVGSADGNVKLAAAGNADIGVSTDVDTDVGHPCDVQLDGIARVEAGGAVTYGGMIGAGENGKAVAVASGEAIGMALDSGVAGDVIRVLIVRSYVAPAASQET